MNTLLNSNSFPIENFIDKKISELSLWNDDKWSFDFYSPGISSICIIWNVPFGDGYLTDPKYAYFLDISKRLIWLLANDPADGQVFCKPATLRSKSASLLFLLKWMCLPENDYQRFEDFDNYTIDEYVTFLISDFARRGRKKTAKSFHSELKILVDLYEHKFIKVQPFGGDSAFIFAKKIAENDDNGWIPFIPDEIVMPLIAEIEQWINYKVLDVIKLSKMATDLIYDKNMAGNIIRRRDGKKSKQLLIRVGKKFVKLIKEFSFTHIDESIDSWRPPPKSRKDVTNLISDAATACAIAVLLFVAPRVSELLSMQIDNVFIRLSEEGDIIIYFIHGKTVKLEASSREVKWVAGAKLVNEDDEPLPVKAIRLLEELLTPWRIWGGTTHLFLGGYFWFASKAPVMPSSKTMLNRKINHFVRKYVNLSYQWHFSTHQFRKTFPRFVARQDGSAIGAVSQQFLHSYETMTDRGYIGTDFELEKLIDSYTERETARALLRLLNSDTPIAGLMGERIEEYRSCFKGMTFDEQAADLKWIVNDSNFIIHANDWGLCIEGGNTVCGEGTEHRNKKNMCPSTCISCENFCVDNKHIGYWNERRDRNESILKSMSNLSNGRATMLHERISECDRVLKKIG